MRKLLLRSAIVVMGLGGFFGPAEAAPTQAVAPCVTGSTNASGIVVESCTPVTAAAPLPVTSSGTTSPSVGAATIATGQYSNATGAATQIVAARTGAPGTGRVSLTVYNSGSVNCFVGASGVLTSTGIRVLPGGSYTLYTTAALWSVPASGTCTMDYLETY